MSTLSIVRTTLLLFVRHGIQHNILFVQVQKCLQLGKALALFSQLVRLCKRLRKLFLGQSFPGVDEWLEDTLNRRYGGSSRKAVLVAYRDALKRWRLMTGNE